MSTNKSGKAALYSALIFPGAGLWWLKLYARACIFMVPAAGILWYISTKLYEGVKPVYEKLQREAAEGLIDISNMDIIVAKLSDEIHRSLAAQQDQLFSLEVILVVCWLCSIASSYFAGKKLDQNTSFNTSSTSNTLNTKNNPDTKNL